MTRLSLGMIKPRKVDMMSESIIKLNPFSSVYVKSIYLSILCFILSDRFDFHVIDNLSIAVHAFDSRILMTLTKSIKKKQDGNCTRMLQAILNKSRRQHPIKHQLCGHLPPIIKII